MLAANLDKNKYKNICIIETNSKLAPKIKVSGGAKCNITNEFVSCDNYLGDNLFAKELLEKFSKDDLLAFLNKNGVFPKINPKIVKGTYFCNSSQDVIDMFTKLTSHVKKYMNTTVIDVTFDKTYKIKTDSLLIETKKLVVASGGLSYSVLGASGIAYEIAKKFGHTVTKLEPALVGFTVQKDQFWFKNLAGISTEVDVYVEGKTFEGSLLFAHKGCTGPVILSTSLHWKKGKIAIDFLPKQNLDSFLSGNKIISSALPLPKRFTQEFLASFDIEDKSVSKLSFDEKEKLNLLKYYEMAPAGNFGYTKAEVTKGGISTNEINHESFESLKQKDLFFIGECLDLTGELGGFNFQIVFSEAMVCAKYLNKN